MLVGPTGDCPPFPCVKTTLVVNSCQIKDYDISVCYFSAKHTALRKKDKDWLAQNQDNVFEWNDISTFELLFL